MSHKMVIVSGQAGSLRQAEQYLRNRQWDVFSTDNLKEAISEAVKRKADFVLISADHPNRRVKNLPKLIKQALPSARLIGYIESNSRVAINALTELQFESVVYPPVSGPSVERAVLKILKDEREAEQRQNQKFDPGAQAAASTKDEVFVAKGEKMKPAYYATQPSARGQVGDMQKAMMKALGSAKAVEAGVGNRGKFFYGGAAVTNPQVAKPPDAANMDGALMSDVQSLPNPSAFEAQLGGKPKADPYQADWSGLEDRLDAVPLDAEAGGKPPESLDEGPPTKPSLDPAAFLASAPLGVSYETDPARTKKKLQLGELGARASRGSVQFKQDPKNLPEQDGLFAQLTQRALDESVSASEDEDYERLGSSEQFACLVVRSAKFSGYLIVGLGQNRKIDVEFLLKIRTRLIQIMREEGEDVSDSEPMQLELEQVSLEDWAFHQGRFLKKAVHNSQEIAIAFFQGLEMSPKLEQSEIEYMLKLKIDGLEKQSDLDFDLYIFLPTNNRLLLYTPNGRRVAQDQRDRLVDKGVTHLHLRKESEPLVQRYHTRARLNEKIMEFRNHGQPKPV